MEFRTIRALVEVVRQGGFTQAAKTVFATQSTVSKAVKQLEDELGVQLLDRIGHSSRVTAAGEIVYRYGKAMLGLRNEMIAELEELRGLRRGTLRLGVPPVGSNALFAGLFAEFRRKYPNVEIQLVEHGSRRLEELLLEGVLDVAVSLLPVSEQFQWQEVRREPIDLLVNKEHPLAQRSQVAFSEIAEVPMILYGQGFALNPIITGACRKNGFAPKVTAQSSNVDFVMGLVAANLGVALVPRLIAEQQGNPDTRAVPIGEPEIFWDIAQIWRRGGYLPPAARVWLELCLSSFSRRPLQDI
jgi:DNA-binding transcriptional LysR family regulator